MFNKLKNEYNILKEDIRNLQNEKIQLENETNNLKYTVENFKIEINKLNNEILSKKDFITITELKYIDSLTGIEFEHYVAKLLNYIGFDSRVTKASQDGGCDVIATRGNTSYVFQCKLYSSPVGNKAVQEIYSAKGLYRCDKAVVITNNYFTKQAKEEAKTLNVELWDRVSLSGLIPHYDKENINIENFSIANIFFNNNHVNKLTDICIDNSLFQNKLSNQQIIEVNSNIDIDNIDSFLQEAIEIVVETGQASTSFIQKRFRIGYARAVKIIDRLEEFGVISGYQGSESRKVLWTTKDIKNFKHKG